MFQEASEDRPVRRTKTVRTRKLRHCAVLVDFENIYSTLTREAGHAARMDDPGVDLDALDDSVEILSNLREHLRKRYHCIMAIGRSYADFDRLGGDAQSQLQLLAFEPRFMLAAKDRSSADILLSIDAIEMLLTRPELEMFAIVGGARDYLPVVRRLREHLKQVVLVGFGKSTSGDLRQVVGEENFIAAENLLPETVVGGGNGTTGVERPASPGPETDSARDPLPEGSDLPADEETLEQCMTELLSAHYQYGGRTVWLTPFLRMLNDRFPYLDNRGRKRLVEDLEERGAIRIGKVEGDPYPYSVVEINWNEPWVQTLNEARGNTGAELR